MNATDLLVLVKSGELELSKRRAVPLPHTERDIELRRAIDNARRELDRTDIAVTTDVPFQVEGAA